MSIFGAVAAGAGMTIAGGTVLTGLSNLNKMVKCRSCGAKMSAKALPGHMRNRHGSKRREERHSRTRHHSRGGRRPQHSLPKGWEF